MAKQLKSYIPVTSCNSLGYTPVTSCNFPADAYAYIMPRLHVTFLGLQVTSGVSYKGLLPP